MGLFRRLKGLPLAVGALLVAASCHPKTAARADVRAVEESLIQSTDQSCQQAVQAKSASQVINCYTQNAVWVLSNLAEATGHDAILTAWRNLFIHSNLALSWRTTQIVAARSGEIGYSLYTYQLTAHPDNSKLPITDRGEGLAVWKRQPDGKWKMAANILSSHPAGPSPASR
jgi:ketosteroid isomerase-like protein